MMKNAHFTEKDYAHYLYVQYMEKMYDSQHVGSSIALINLDNDKSTTEVLIGATHRYRFANWGFRLFDDT